MSVTAWSRRDALDDALRAADMAEQMADLEPADPADEFGALRTQAGNCVLDVDNGEHDAVRAHNVVRPVAARR